MKREMPVRSKSWNSVDFLLEVQQKLAVELSCRDPLIELTDFTGEVVKGRDSRLA